jgi:hypothetical protein
MYLKPSAARSHTTTTTTTTMHQFSEQDRTNLLKMKKQLRRLKRRLFLEAVKSPESSVDKFRAMILTLALDSATGESSTTKMSFYDSDSTLASIDPIYEGEVRICQPVG